MLPIHDAMRAIDVVLLVLAMLFVAYGVAAFVGQPVESGRPVTAAFGLLWVAAGVALGFRSDGVSSTEPSKRRRPLELTLDSSGARHQLRACANSVPIAIPSNGVRAAGRFTRYLRCPPPPILSMAEGPPTRRPFLVLERQQ